MSTLAPCAGYRNPHKSTPVVGTPFRVPGKRQTDAFLRHSAALDIEAPGVYL